jgi:DNA-binding MarR family transcriptional regulator
LLRRALARFPNLDVSAIDCAAMLEDTADKVMTHTFGPLDKQGISRARFSVLLYLSLEEELGNEPPGPSAIAENLNVTRATMTDLLDGLERDGHVERRAVDNDRRAQAIHLTHKGRTLFERLVPPLSGTIAHVFEPLTPAERETLIELLTKLTMQVSPHSS